MMRCLLGMNLRLAAAGLFVALSGCTGPEGRPLLEGQWGGSHAGLEADSAGARLEFDCAGGRIRTPILLDHDGRFEAMGTFARGGGPVSIDDTTRAEPATYSGRVAGRQMSLVITVVAAPPPIGPYELIRGGNPRVYKCD